MYSKRKESIVLVLGAGDQTQGLMLELCHGDTFSAPQKHVLPIKAFLWLKKHVDSRSG
jgi:hypothetical protein